MISGDPYRRGADMTPDDEQHLRRAIALAAEARAAGNRPFGALLVLEGAVIAEDRNTVIADDDIAAHPELKLARWAARELDRDRAARTTMYTSCMPCAMCGEAIRRAALGRVVYALSPEQLRQLVPDPDQSSPTYEGPALFDEARVPFEGLVES